MDEPDRGGWKESSPTLRHFLPDLDFDLKQISMSPMGRLLQSGLQIVLLGGVLLTLLLIDPLAVHGFREPKMVAILFLAGVAAILGGLMGIMGHRSFSIPASLAALLPLLGILVYQFCSQSAGDFGGSGRLVIDYSLYILAPVVAWGVILICGGMAFRSPRARSALALTITVALTFEVVIVLLEIIQNQTGLQLNPIAFTGEIDLLGQEIRERIYGTIGNPNFVAGYMAIAFFPVLGWTVGSERRVAGLFGVLILSATMLAILATRSKGAVLALFVGAAQLLYLVWRNHRRAGGHMPATPGPRSWFYIPLLLLAVAVILVGWFLADQSAGPVEGSFLHHWFETLSFKGDSIAVRALLAECGFRMWAPHPWLGLGAGQFKIHFLETLRQMLLGEDAGLFSGRVARLQSLRANHLHNEYLQVLVEWGLVGLASVLLFLAWSQVNILSVIDRSKPDRDRWVRMGLLAGFWAALGGSLFDLPFHRPTQAYLLALLLGVNLAPGQGVIKSQRIWRGTVDLAAGFILLALSLWFLHGTAMRYVSLREVFMAKSVLEGKIPGGDTGRATEVIQRAIYRVPGDGDNYYYQAHIQLYSRKDPNAAISTIRRAQKLCDEPGLYLLEARAQIEKGNFSAAEPLLDLMKTLDRDRPGLHYLLGRVYQATQRFEEARNEYMADIHWSEGNSRETNPDLEDSILRLASLLEDAGDFNRAVIYYEKFLKKKEGQIPNYPLAQLSLARIFRDHLFDRDLTRKYLQEALFIFQKNGNVSEAQKIENQLGEASRQPSRLP